MMRQPRARSVRKAFTLIEMLVVLLIVLLGVLLIGRRCACLRSGATVLVGPLLALVLRVLPLSLSRGRGRLLAAVDRSHVDVGRVGTGIVRCLTGKGAPVTTGDHAGQQEAADDKTPQLPASRIRFGSVRHGRSPLAVLTRIR